MFPPRLRRLPRHPLPDGSTLFAARSFRSRLLGLALLREPPPDCALLITGCSVHTFGMRFALDIEFLDGSGRSIRTATAVPPGRIVRERRAAAVVERPSA